MILFLGFAALLQQAPFLGATSPASGDTVGYWQQHVHYQIVATLDESQTKLRARGTLVYVNNSPDTLREMYIQQYLNAFRPGSKWSAADTRENRERFQHLGDPNYGYERFTQAPVVDGVPVIVDYPGAPDSTVAHFRLPHALAPHDSLTVRFVWDARPSTVFRRQGRRGRSWDFAQWYPKVAVYDRGGWEPNAFVPQGELYGEFGTYDVTLVVRDDQIVGATGVPVSGDPGWARVSRTGPPRLAANAYADVPPAPTDVDVPAGYRAVRFYAENVHHFAWSASPDYVYEGGVYVRHVAPTHFATWDTVSINVLYKPGDDSTWGGGRVVDRSIRALQWLESIYGPYGWPQFTDLHRLEQGGTEFPMMIMTGSPSVGMILHEGGHEYTYGMLANNEWRSGWMDEGLTDYQTYWAQGLTPEEQARTVQAPPLLAPGYRVNAVTMTPQEESALDPVQLELLDRTQPIGTTSAQFHEFGIYNAMIYDRARLMYGQLRDVLGDSAFHAFLHDYFARWAFKHVDERAMRASAERVSGRNLGWFFDQWVHGTGLMDYALGDVRVTTDGTRYETIAHVTRLGTLRHPMPVGVQTASGWTIGRADPMRDAQDVHIVTTERPTLIELDPDHDTYDWDWRNNVQSAFLLSVREPRLVYNWPYLAQTDRGHSIVALAPAAWYSDPQGPVIGIRAHTNYLGDVDVHDGGIGFSARNPRDSAGHAANVLTRAQIWARADNLYLPGMSRPLMGYGGAFNLVDGLVKLDVHRTWDLTPFLYAPSPIIHAQAYATIARPLDSLFVPEQWDDNSVGEVGGSAAFTSVVDDDGEYEKADASLAAGYTTSDGSATGDPSRGYLRATASLGAVRSLVGKTSQLHVRIFGGVAHNAPRQRAVFASTADPFETFNNDLFRPRGALFKQDGINYLPLGGAALRGFGIDVPLTGVVAANGEVTQQLAAARGQWGNATFLASGFGDAGAAQSTIVPLPGSALVDAGVGVIARGRLYDRSVYVRLDAPLFVNHPSIAGGTGLGGNGSFAPRWTITVGDIW